MSGTPKVSSPLSVVDSLVSFARVFGFQQDSRLSYTTKTAALWGQMFTIPAVYFEERESGI